MTFADMAAAARDVVSAFQKVERRPWTVEVSVIELTKQLGDLAKKVMTFERYYLPDRDNHPVYASDLRGIANELADLLYGTIRIGLHYGIDLEQAYVAARRDELAYAIHAATLTREPTMTMSPSPFSTKAHYEDFLCRHYDWTLGGFDEACKRYADLLAELNVIAGENARALDLGAGTGAQSVPLAQAGFDVTAVDVSPGMLAILKEHAGELTIHTLEADMLEARTRCGSEPYDIVVCMGDVLIHLADEAEVWRLFLMVRQMCKSGARLILQYRDMSAPLTAGGAPGVFPIRMEPARAMLTALSEHGPWIVATDLLLIGDEKGWDVGQHSYRKLRLSAQRCVQLLAQAGFRVDAAFVRAPFTVIASTRP